MGFRHVAHEHDLSLYQEGEKKFQKTSCDGCDELISGPAYYCDTCDEFILHKLCFELPNMIEYQLHHSADHPLILLPKISSGFICNVCRNLRFGFMYNCRECEFNLDVICASQNKDDKSKISSDDQSENLVTEIEHFLDSHKLCLFYYRKQDEDTCRACNLPLSSDACYGCLVCSLFLHKACLEIPKTIQHPYHPHSLKASGQIMCDLCHACKTTAFSLRYSCSEDNFNLHMLCAKTSMMPIPPLKHKCHYNHSLYCFVPHDSIGSACKCNHCDQLCESAYYMCFECDFNVHLRCITLPPKVDYPGHPHTLTLKDSFREDDSDVYCCYACGEQRNPNFPVYWCEECPVDVPYVAHVECIISEVDEFHSSSGNTSPKAVSEGLQVEPVKEDGDSKEQGDEIHSHGHPLILHAKEGLEAIPCDVCMREIEGDMRTCEVCSDVHFHPSCADLPEEITRPFHTHSLYGVFGSYELSMCSLCRNISEGYYYECSKCCFSLGRECAFLTDDQYENQKDKYPEVKIRHFSHDHELTLARCSSMLNRYCSLCSLLVSGSIYCCLHCGFFLHESCSEAQQQVQPSYHLPHRLISQYLGGLLKYCGLCRSQILNIGYSCYECQFFIHFRCGNLLMSPLKQKFHEHNLFPFAPCEFWELDDYTKLRFRCCACSGLCIDSFYRCVKCNLNVHPECIPLPKIVKHRDHADPLTLMNCMCEDDSGVYYCDICQEPRNPNHPVYWCQECQIMECSFVAHVGCVIQEGDASLKVISWEDSEPIFGSLFDSEEAE